MRYANASEMDRIQWGIEELELRESDRQTRTAAEAEQRKAIRAKAIGATLSQANMLCRDAKAFLNRKCMKV